jgi:hypothetical protein
MDKLNLTVQNQGRVFYSKWGYACLYHSVPTNLKMKTQPKQLLGSLPLAFALLG